MSKPKLTLTGNEVVDAALLILKRYPKNEAGVIEADMIEIGMMLFSYRPDKRTDLLKSHPTIAAATWLRGYFSNTLLVTTYNPTRKIDRGRGWAWRIRMKPAGLARVNEIEAETSDPKFDAVAEGFRLLPAFITKLMNLSDRAKELIEEIRNSKRGSRLSRTTAADFDTENAASDDAVDATDDAVDTTATPEDDDAFDDIDEVLYDSTELPLPLDVAPRFWMAEEPLSNDGQEGMNKSMTGQSIQDVMTQAASQAAIQAAQQHNEQLSVRIAELEAVHTAQDDSIAALTARNGELQAMLDNRLPPEIRLVIPADTKLEIANMKAEIDSLKEYITAVCAALGKDVKAHLATARIGARTNGVAPAPAPTHGKETSHGSNL